MDDPPDPLAASSKPVPLSREISQTVLASDLTIIQHNDPNAVAAGIGSTNPLDSPFATTIMPTSFSSIGGGVDVAGDETPQHPDGHVHDNSLKINTSDDSHQVQSALLPSHRNPGSGDELSLLGATTTHLAPTLRSKIDALKRARSQSRLTHAESPISIKSDADATDGLVASPQVSSDAITHRVDIIADALLVHSETQSIMSQSGSDEQMNATPTTKGHVYSHRRSSTMPGGFPGMAPMISMDEEASDAMDVDEYLSPETQTETPNEGQYHSQLSAHAEASQNVEVIRADTKPPSDSDPYGTQIPVEVDELLNSKNPSTSVGGAAFQSQSIVDDLTPAQSLVGPDNMGQEEQKDHATTDLLPQIGGLYRLLELYSEQGSGGLVDKVIIAQDSLKEFVDVVKPGAYTSVTKIEFASLDEILIKPLGIYGSRSEIVTLLTRLCPSMQQSTINLLSATSSQSDALAGPSLSSGIYITIGIDMDNVRRAHVIYWPEETTWNDDAISAVRRNRATFMRYLTKLTDQQRVLISPEHAAALVWDTQSDGQNVGAENLLPEDEQEEVDDEEDTNRLFRFRVEKTEEEEEGVTAHPGFKVHYPDIRPFESIDQVTTANKFAPRMVLGERRQGFLTASRLSTQTRSSTVKTRHTQLGLQNLLRDPFQEIILDVGISPESVHYLIRDGLRGNVDEWDAGVKSINQPIGDASQKQLVEGRLNIEQTTPGLSHDIQRALVRIILDVYPANALDLEFFQHLAPDLIVNGAVDVSSEQGQGVFLAQLVTTYPTIHGMIDQAVSRAKIQHVSDHEYITLKERFFATSGGWLSDSYATAGQSGGLIAALTDNPNVGNRLFGYTYMFVAAVANAVVASRSAPSVFSPYLDTSNMDSNQISDPELMSRICDTSCPSPDIARELRRLLSIWLITTTMDLCENLTRQVNALRLAMYEKSVQAEDLTLLSKEINDAFREFRIRAMSASARVTFQVGMPQRSLTIKSVTNARYSNIFHVTGEERTVDVPQVQYIIHTLSLTEGDRQSLSLDPSFIPEPHIRPQLSVKFCLPLQEHIRHIQLVGNGHCLLLIDDNATGCSLIYLEHTDNLAAALRRESFKKKLPHANVGRNFLCTVDESKRFIAIITATESSSMLHILSMNETYTTIQMRGSPYDLAPSFSGTPVFSHIGFLPGTEEIFFVEESTGHTRVFSMITEQFKPASIFIHPKSLMVLATSDGSCLMVVEPTVDNSPELLRIFHFSSMGNSGYNGVMLPMPDLDPGSLVVTSIGVYNAVHLLGLSVLGGYCLSQRLHITNKTSNFSFREQGRGANKNGPVTITTNNSLLTCHAEVWTRYPVIAAIPRQPPSSTRLPPSLHYVTDTDHNKFEPHFQRLVREFQSSTRKPTAGRLNAISIRAQFRDAMPHDIHGGVSLFPVGKWLVELLCLIPIHVAVTGSNRFIPLKDGVLSPDFERSLLGADLPYIVNSLSIGWYESIFRSYLATKPVKVVSSMGEQSTGKSYALNHLVDTSFAGSAMRCTEGVWLSLTPTDQELIVALDFEGIHSIERSAQEDMLLVLFNTALSNLVLFRNNFAMSRDIASLFKSFQASTSVLDPGSNPNLFRSTLAIIIKDVVDADVQDIVKEFALKFEKIVRDEREDNFISKLHRDNIRILPWPVIESPKFYGTMGLLKRELQAQPVTHLNAAVFLETMKTLMAKLKICDWGAVDQNLVAQRVHTLLSKLSTAMVHGVFDFEPDLEPLKNLDTNETIISSDTSAIFFLNSPSQKDMHRETCLSALRNNHLPPTLLPRGSIPESQWMGNLQAHLSALAFERVVHVREWITSNMARFPQELAEMDTLKRGFDDQAADLVSGVELCKMTCSNCKLLCLKGRRHDGTHDCDTSHQCNGYMCDFDTNPCGALAGHDGRHLCNVNAHMCGEPCELTGKQGCQGACTQPVNHTSEPHICSSRNHACGAPCALSTVSPDLCSLPCIVDCRDDHDEHVCENRATCPVKCNLCARLCAAQNHFHALDPNAVHLCGQTHACNELCESPGICVIATTPQSIESTFVGRHETFQYTKYAQVSSRGKCIKPIAAGTLTHEGPHVHSMDSFHFCETRCPSCGYFCTLPLNHTQATHETSHGSMENTEWVIDDDEAEVFREVSGRKFASGDAGASVLCNQVCSDLGRHVHIDQCRTKRFGPCSEPETEHIMSPRGPQTDSGKDWITHNLHWSRSGFKDPYPQDLRSEFAKCDAVCYGPEHQGGDATLAQASQCILDMFHPPATATSAVVGGHISSLGHSFMCQDPSTLHIAYHVIFLLDGSGSMTWNDRQPLPYTPNSEEISALHNNRYGALLSALNGFWVARAAATRGGHGADAYSVMLFNNEVVNIVTNDLTSTPSTLLENLMVYQPGGGTDFCSAISAAHEVMVDNWDDKRVPVLIFLSDGEGIFPEEELRDICLQAKSLGHPLAFHAVAFGPENTNSLQQMVDMAEEEYNAQRGMATVDPQCTYTEAIDTIQLAESFLDIAEQMRKPRAALLRTSRHETRLDPTMIQWST